MVMRMKNICPPGVFCITPGLLIAFGLVIAAIFIFFAQQRPHGIQERTQVHVPTPINVNVTTDGDGRYSQAPRPQRIWNSPPDLRGALIPPGGAMVNMPTRGLPESYQSMGLLKTEDGQMLPLYGRRTAARSDRFNYYTRTDTYNPVPLPIHYKRRDCQDDVGCDELMSGEEIKISPTGQVAKATLYRFDGPTYIPGII
uniref:Uncharacterized protein n=1 Tax=viral metagenome TaxID=1070528 RepID=A0A6C0BB48_9ZZZZ